MNECHHKQSSGAAIFWSWFLLISTCVISVVPVVGFISWLVGLASIAIVTILAIVIIGEGRTNSGVFILLAAYIFTPLFIFVAPVASSAIFMTNMQDTDGPKIEIKVDAVTDQRLKNLPEPSTTTGE